MGIGDLLAIPLLLVSFGILAFTCFSYLVIFSPLILVGWFSAVALDNFYGNQPLVHAAAALFFTYASYCLIFLLKGILIVLKLNGKYAWIALLVFCVAITCVVPVYLGHFYLQDFFKGYKIPGLHIWTWTVGALLGIVAYTHYQFHRDKAPNMVLWSYRLGVNITQRLLI